MSTDYRTLGKSSSDTAVGSANDETYSARARFQDLVELTHDWIWETDADGRLTFSGPQVESLLGYSPSEILGLALTDFMAADTAERLPSESPAAWEDPQPFHASERVFVTLAHELRRLVVSGVPIFDPEGLWQGYRGICREVNPVTVGSERTQTLLAEAVARANHDSLTGLWNRRAFQERLENEIARSRRSNASFSIVLADIDNFKYFNEAYGHLAGDEVLRVISSLVRTRCRSGDAVARLGGDEFAVLLPGLDRKETESRMTALCETVGDTGFRPAGHTVAVPIGISCGVAVWPDDSHSPEPRTDHGISNAAAALLLRADERLYKNKASGRDMWSTTLREEWKRDFPGFEVLDSLVVAVHIRDRYTLRHSEDVLLYSILIAQELGLPLSDIEDMQRAALLHDIGMIGVPERYLRRPGRLSQTEFEAVKLHPAMGAAIVSTVRALEPVLPAIRFHHERWDGGGYPFGVSQLDIPLPARIISVADAFSAMTTDRPFRQGLSLADAASELRAGAGSQWDPSCVAAFLRAYFD